MAPRVASRRGTGRQRWRRGMIGSRFRIVMGVMRVRIGRGEEQPVILAIHRRKYGQPHHQQHVKLPARETPYACGVFVRVHRGMVARSAVVRNDTQRRGRNRARFDTPRYLP